MHMLQYTVALAAASIAAATPIDLVARAGVSISEAQLLKIAPTSKTCDASSDTAKECRTAAQAAPVIQRALARYSLNTAGEAAAVISLMAFETGDFKYNRNHHPGRPGQGTRNMQMIDFNIKYVQSIPNLKGKLAAAAGSDNPNSASMTDAQKNATLDLVVSKDCYDFGSAMWFLTTQCQQDIRDGLQKGGIDGYTKYITDCVGTTMTDDRKTYYDNAVAALN